MSIAITPRPTYPIPGHSVSIGFTASAGGDFVRLTCTAAPDGSELAETIERESSPAFVHEDDIDRRFEFTPDLPGRYVFRAVEIDRNVTAFAGGWLNDPSAERTDVPVSTTDVYLTVGTSLTQLVGWGNNTGDLVVHLFDDYVREVTERLNGEDGPRIDTAANAIRDGNVDAAVAALADVNSATLVSSLSSVATSFATVYNLHLADTSYHSAADTTNVITAAYAQSVDLPARLVSEYQARFRDHIQGYDGTGYGVNTWHGGTTTEALPQAPAPTTPAETFVALGELVVAYDVHWLTGAPVHLVADTTNTFTMPTGNLLHVHYRVAQALRQQSTSSPDSTVHTGEPLLTTLGGMR